MRASCICTPQVGHSGRTIEFEYGLAGLKIDIDSPNHRREHDRSQSSTPGKKPSLSVMFSIVDSRTQEKPVSKARQFDGRNTEVISTQVCCPHTEQRYIRAPGLRPRGSILPAKDVSPPHLSHYGDFSPDGGMAAPVIVWANFLSHR